MWKCSYGYIIDALHADGLGVARRFSADQRGCQPDKLSASSAERGAIAISLLCHLVMFLHPRLKKSCLCKRTYRSVPLRMICNVRSLVVQAASCMCQHLCACMMWILN